MSIVSAFNSAIAIIEARETDAIEMLRPFLGTDELPNISDIQFLAARLDQAVKDRLIQEAHDMLRSLLRDEMMADTPTEYERLSDYQKTAFWLGRRDALQVFENKWQDLKTQLKPQPEYEPVDLPERPVGRIRS
jgi:hypothetical protein